MQLILTFNKFPMGAEWFARTDNDDLYEFKVIKTSPGSNGRVLRLFQRSNGGEWEPARGGQWHYSLQSAIDRVLFIIACHNGRERAEYEAQINRLQQELEEALCEASNLREELHEQTELANNGIEATRQWQKDAARLKIELRKAQDAVALWDRHACRVEGERDKLKTKLAETQEDCRAWEEAAEYQRSLAEQRLKLLLRDKKTIQQYQTEAARQWWAESHSMDARWWEKLREHLLSGGKDDAEKQVQTFEEFLNERYDLSSLISYSDYVTALGEAFVQYADEVLVSRDTKTFREFYKERHGIDLDEQRLTADGGVFSVDPLVYVHLVRTIADFLDGKKAWGGKP